MNLHTVDLNLFLALQAIYRTRSVTLAGERLGMTQSALSHALRRLRVVFGDPLLKRGPRGMEPTDCALALRQLKLKVPYRTTALASFTISSYTFTKCPKSILVRSA